MRAGKYNGTFCLFVYVYVYVLSCLLCVCVCVCVSLSRSSLFLSPIFALSLFLPKSIPFSFPLHSPFLLLSSLHSPFHSHSISSSFCLSLLTRLLPGPLLLWGNLRVFHTWFLRAPRVVRRERYPRKFEDNSLLYSGHEGGKRGEEKDAGGSRGDRWEGRKERGDEGRKEGRGKLRPRWEP